ncbi:MAG TPA: acylphosphatase [Candidatus Binataceae bacterium]|nr:acylphosphatase [Candidatus Binataceae bacterium]
MASNARLRLIVSGQVQGVGFRFATVTEARRLGLAGWVKNLVGGSVEILAEGDKDSLSKLAAWAHRGPRFAGVDEVEEQWMGWRGELAGFKIR